MSIRVRDLTEQERPRSSDRLAAYLAESKGLPIKRSRIGKLLVAEGLRWRQQEADYGRRGSGYVFGAFAPATGAALTRPYGGRTIANWVDFLCHVEAWLPAEAGAVYAVLDNLSAHRAADVLLFSWGRRRRHRPKRKAGPALAPTPA